ncbi:MAG TPA: acyl-CoA thioesterase [Ruminococcaceae bacterium]|nr:acyl-CoA thioesterase [Oscillospiraceae bacterium]
MAENEKTVKHSKTEQVHIVFGSHINGAGRLFGGKLMQWIDTVGAVVARRHAHCEVTTAAIDSLEFKAAVRVNSTLVLIGEMTYAGRTSMEVKVDTYTEELSGLRKLVNRAYIVFVALDSENRPKEVPGLKPESDEEIFNFWQGEQRQRLRKKRRDQL